MPVGIHPFAKLVKFFLSIEVFFTGHAGREPRLSPGARPHAGAGAAEDAGMWEGGLGER